MGGWTLFGSIGAALGAAVCCVGPLILVSLGVGGAWIGEITTLEPYRPLFMAVAAGLLGFGFYRAYGTSGGAPTTDRTDCDEECELPRAQHVNRVALWVATAVVLALFASPHLLAVGSSHPAGATESTAAAPSRAPENAAAAESAPTRRLRLKVDGMTCAGCARTLASELGELEGVRSAEATLEPPQATVQYNPSSIEPHEIAAATEEIGYPSEVLDR